MALNPIKILRNKMSGHADSQAREDAQIRKQSGAGANSPAVAASRAAMRQRRAQSAAANPTAIKNGLEKNPVQAESQQLEGASHQNGSRDNGNHSSDKPTQIAPADIVVPSQIGRYTLGGKLGSGTCGVVHKALDTVLDREVAIKLSPAGEPHVTTGKVPGAQCAYQTELYAAGRLRHPNIVTVHDAGQFGELNYMVMEAVRGRTLKHFGKGQKLLPPYRALEVIIDCCKALDYSHDKGILHRDVKPANIMIASNGSVKLLDYGIAVGLTDDVALSRKGPTLGTPNYMSPEQILGRALGPASDLYSLGTVLFELVTGKQLYKARKVKDLFRAVVHERAPAVAEFRPDLPVEFSNVIAKVLEKKPEQRFQSGTELIAALLPFVEEFKTRDSHTPDQRHLASYCAELSFFAGLNETDVLRLLDEANARTFGAGSELLSGGNFERRLLVIMQGVVREYRNGTVEQVFSDGDSLGETGFIQGNVVDSQLFAVTPVKVVEISSAALAALPPALHISLYKRASAALVARMALSDQRFKPDIIL